MTPFYSHLQNCLLLMQHAFIFKHHKLKPKLKFDQMDF